MPHQLYVPYRTIALGWDSTRKYRFYPPFTARAVFAIWNGLTGVPIEVVAGTTVALLRSSVAPEVRSALLTFCIIRLLSKSFSWFDFGRGSLKKCFKSHFEEIPECKRLLVVLLVVCRSLKRREFPTNGPSRPTQLGNVHFWVLFWSELASHFWCAKHQPLNSLWVLDLLFLFRFLKLHLCSQISRCIVTSVAWSLAFSLYLRHFAIDFRQHNLERSYTCVSITHFRRLIW